MPNLKFFFTYIFACFTGFQVWAVVSCSPKRLLRQLSSLVFFVCFSVTSATAEYGISLTEAASDLVKNTTTGTQQSDSGTIRVTAAISGNSVVFSFSHYQGKSFNYQIAGAVYRDSYSSSNLVSSNSVSAGSYGVSVSIPLSVGSYKVLLATKDSVNNNIGFYFNSASFEVTQINTAPIVSGLGGVQYGAGQPISINFTVTDEESTSMNLIRVHYGTSQNGTYVCYQDLSASTGFKATTFNGTGVAENAGNCESLIPAFGSAVI